MTSNVAFSVSVSTATRVVNWLPNLLRTIYIVTAMKTILIKILRKLNKEVWGSAEAEVDVDAGFEDSPCCDVDFAVRLLKTRH